MRSSLLSININRKTFIYARFADLASIDANKLSLNHENRLADNIRIASNASSNSLTEEGLKVFEQVKAVMLEKTKVPCTGCAYCMPCPFGVDIPGCFSCYNDKYLMNDKSSRFKYFQTMGTLSLVPAVAPQCHECGKCETHCPQKIEIRKQLKTITREFEGPLYRPIVAVVRKVMRIK